MSQINELEARIAAALDRISAGVGKLALPEPVDTGPIEALEAAEAALSEERIANAQLEERIRALTERQETAHAALTAELDSLRESSDAIEAALQDMRAAHTRLEETSVALRTAAEDGLSDATQINAALQAELDAERAARAADVAEAAAILSALEPKLVKTPEPEPEVETGEAS